MLVSIVVRTLNEARYLGDLLAAIAGQRTDFGIETIVVDSGSTDRTIEIADAAGARLLTIEKSEFSFGRSLNRGCAAARGEILVFVSGHCVPVDMDWIETLCRPIAEGRADYTYGGQFGGARSHFSERRIFAKYFPRASAIPQEGFFCNNANAALRTQVWQAHGFDEDLTGLEDMDLARRLVAAGGRVGYVAEAAVHHHHSESWAQVRRRFEREALALQSIMPEVQLSRLDMARYILSSVWMDARAARRQGRLRAELADILRYRIAQFGGSYAGNSNHRRLSRAQKERFFYPKISEDGTQNARYQVHGRASAHEGQQPTR